MFLAEHGGALDTADAGRYALKPVGAPYASTVAYIEAHYLVD